MEDAPTPQMRKKRSLGQYFLNNPRVATRMAEAAEIAPGETVLEIGPGEGFLTHAILDSGARVIAVETDRRCIDTLEKTFARELASAQLSLVSADIRDFDPTAHGLLQQQYKLVANIPYFLSGLLFRRFLSEVAQPAVLVFLVQKEIAERIARSEKESLLSLSVKAFGTPEYIQTVTAGNFTPQPKVASAILKVGNISRKHFTNANEKLFFELLHYGFAARRKQLLGALAQHYDRAALIHIFSTLGLSATVRAEDVPLETWLKLTHTLTSHKK